MQPDIRRRILLLASLATLAAACGDVSTSSSTSPAGAEPTSGTALSPDITGAPLTLGYEVLGNPVVGKPVGVEVSMDTDLDNRPVTLAYRVSEANSLTFPESQATEVDVVPVAGADLRPVQVTVIPQRDGRVFLNVTATIETDTGSVKKAIAIPLQVAPRPLSEDELSENE